MAHQALPVPLDPTRTGDDALRLERGIQRLVVGQEEAIRQIVNVYQTFVAGMNSPGRPVGNFLFLGPSGTGKTRVVEATGEALLGDPSAVVKIDCAEFQHSHEIAKLLGSPPGYLGHRETQALLSQEALDQHHTADVPLSLVLFDEIEKGSDALWNLLLGILDKGILTLGDNRKVDFAQCLIFLTSNLGAKEMEALAGPGLGFSPLVDATSSAALTQRKENIGVQAARKRFSPEFMNRIDKTVVFHSLGDAELQKVLDLELAQVQRLMLMGTPCLFQVSAEARQLLIESGTDSKYGARHLKRAIERLLVHPMANLVASGQLRSGDRVDIDRTESGFLFQRTDEGLTLHQMYLAAGLAFPIDEPFFDDYGVRRAAAGDPDRGREVFSL
ncbi:MAG: AAA family ATPase [Acidobacteria bacterium]|nr:AAA family ATPase [Acidobacteriota bacterium]